MSDLANALRHFAQMIEENGGKLPDLSPKPVRKRKPKPIAETDRIAKSIVQNHFSRAKRNKN